MIRKYGATRAEHGSTLVEYGVLAGIVSLAAIVAVLSTGKEVEEVFDTTNSAMAQIETDTVSEVPTAFGIIDGQSFSFPLEAGPGESVGQTLTSGGTPNSFTFISGGEGLAIDNSGRITVVDGDAFGTAGTTKAVTIETTDAEGVTDRGQVSITRRDYEDVPGDATTWAYLYPNQVKINTFETTGDHDWFKLVIEDPGQSLSL